MKLIVPALTLMIFTSGFSNNRVNTSREIMIRSQYDLLASTDVKPSFDVFYKAIKGYTHLKTSNQLTNQKYLTVIDFSLSSNQKRLWIIDMDDLTVVHHTLVSHGRNTGDEFATKFSNVPNSNMSSLGFYVTGNTYFGKHGFSLYLNGMEEGVNDNALKRAIVMHSAAYATDDFIKKAGRLGRSFGCPSIPPDQHKEIIEMIKQGSALFIYYPDQDYINMSKFLL